jgi:hypothetical protein
VKSGAGVQKIAAALGKSEESVRAKIRRLKLKCEEDEQANFQCSSSSKLDVEGELPSVEETLKMLNGALQQLDAGGLNKTEIMRLRTIIQGARIYNALLADYINYRAIEEKLVDLQVRALK